jgi:3-hydroxyisobutyrate dehydrogenase-like beta-hydroxyacid dehydrogenase
MRVAFLGLGIMGKPMAANLVKAGHDVTVWNRTPKHVEGATTATTPAEAARNAEVVWICVADTKAVEEVLFGNNGAAQSIQKGTIVIDSSTISPTASLNFAERLREKGADFIDAPVTGSKVGAENASLIFIVGGKEESIAKLQPLFSAMGKQVVHVGPNSHGLGAKLGMNLMIALIYEGFAEALVLVRKLGVDQQKLFSLINASMVKSGVVEYKIPFVEKRDFSPNFPLRLMHKDIKLMLDAGRETGVDLPGLQTVREIYEQSTAAGQEDLDYAATLTVLEQKAGLKNE